MMDNTVQLLTRWLTNGYVIVSDPSPTGGYRLAVSDPGNTQIGLGFGDTIHAAYADCAASMEQFSG